ncbi:MAG TPA: glycoside hydrolase 43 family protein [Verrucomicrobiae bacterium]|nr:glycoside hydrolase 43 family protein [Verrucomicrobiae bacterium]
MTRGAVALMGLLAACAGAWQSDQGNGSFANPPLYADYPDPDIIRVGDDFYFSTTTFVNAPGITILHSKDLVNWEFASHVVAQIDGREEYNLKNGGAYRHGLFATSLRHFQGMFYLAVTPVQQNTRIYYSKDIGGAWRFHELDRQAFDPGLFIDTDGAGYLATSGGWDGHVTLLQLNADFSKVVGSHAIFYHRGVEGSKVVKRGGWYYIFNALPAKLALTCSRATNLFGPYETIEQLSDRTGGHQGAIVDLAAGGDFGFVMKDCGAVGRMTYLCPIFWSNNWPCWGLPEAPGKVPPVARKPVQGGLARQPAASDEFASSILGLQWQWNHNPDNSRWSLTERPGFLRLHSITASNFWLARNTLTQKGQGPWSRGEVRLDLRGLAPGDRCGFGTLGKVNGHIAVRCDQGGALSLNMEVGIDNGKNECRAAAAPIQAKEIWLRADLDFIQNEATCSYSLDGRSWTELGGKFELLFDWRSGTFQGEQFAIFCYNEASPGGFVDVDSFHFSDR